MAFKQNIVQRLCNICSNKFSNQTLKNCRISSSSSVVQSIIPQNLDGVAANTQDKSIFKRFLQRRPLYMSSKEAMPKILPPRGEKLMERLKEMDITRNRIRLQTEGQFNKNDAKKILRASKMEALKLKLGSSHKSPVTYDEFIQICVDECSNRDQGLDLAKVLDNSGFVIVLGNVVFLKPEQVLKAINELMIGDDLPTKELKEMERWKSEIDNKAAKMVRLELWGGLVYLVLQTAAFMRLTFWELSWDVMEPICFYVTSLYFMIGYAYFIRTSREPSFESVFQSRFRVKQKKMMKMEGFDVKKYNELMKACGCRDRSWWMEGL